MSTPLSRLEIERLAELSRLELTPDEVERFIAQLGAILDYVEQVRALDTTAVPATAHLVSGALEREDTPHAILTREEALANAPEAAAEAGLFKVPRVFA